MIPTTLHLEVGACTETGYVRSENQDRMSWAIVPQGHLYIVADGMGGHAGGAQAAELTIQGLERYFTDTSNDKPADTAIRDAFDRTNRDVYEKAHAGDPKTEKMGSTAVILLIFNRFAKIAHVGDSRAYLYRKRKLRLLTKDHTQVQKMVDEGLLTPEQARNHPYASVLDRAIGNRPDINVEIHSDLALKNGDGILLCSDGLSGYADDREIESVMADDLTAQEIVDRLINLALQKGGEDNVTVQFIRFGKSSRVFPIGGAKKFKSIFRSILILAVAAAGSYGLYRSAAQPDDDAKLNLPRVFPQQDRIILHYLQIMRELADQAAKIKICLSDFDVYEDRVDRVEKQSRIISGLESRLSAVKQANQNLESALATAIAEKNDAEIKAQLRSKKLTGKVAALIRKVNTLETRLKQRPSSPQPLVPVEAKEAGKKKE